MKLAYKNLENVIEFPLKKEKPKTLQNFTQLIIMLGALYVANKISIDVWRSLTGH
jgi:hypothetical protein